MLLRNPLFISCIFTCILIFTNRISLYLHKVLVIFSLIGSAVIAILLILAHQNVESINDSSPINMPQSSQRDSIVVKIIQSLILIFLSSCILLNRVNDKQKHAYAISSTIFDVDNHETHNNIINGDSDHA